MTNQDKDLLLDLVVEKSINKKRKEVCNDNFLRIEQQQNYFYNSNDLTDKKEKEPSRVIIIEI